MWLTAGGSWGRVLRPTVAEDRFIHAKILVTASLVTSVGRRSFRYLTVHKVFNLTKSLSIIIAEVSFYSQDREHYLFPISSVCKF